MSPANVKYIIEHNLEVDPTKVEVCPNSIEVIDKSVDAETRVAIRNEYGLPIDKKIFVYGGNLGKTQGIPFLIECLKKCEDIVHWLLVIRYSIKLLSGVARTAISYSIYLGGGVGSGKDSLFKIKKFFIRGDLSHFYIGKRIYDQRKYEELLAMRTDIKNEGFFPKYRG